MQLSKRPTKDGDLDNVSSHSTHSTRKMTEKQKLALERGAALRIIRGAIGQLQWVAGQPLDYPITYEERSKLNTTIKYLHDITKTWKDNNTLYGLGKGRQL